MNKIRRIGIMTAGGDCPGLNAVIRAVAKSAMAAAKLEVVGIEDRMHLLTNESVSNILTIGGTILGTNNRVSPRKYPVKAGDAIENHDVMDRCLEHIEHNQIDALVVIGGDGSMSIASDFVHQGINCIGVPKTIDNDLVWLRHGRLDRNGCARSRSHHRGQPPSSYGSGSHGAERGLDCIALWSGQRRRHHHHPGNPF
jgi:6-phosphofructokinase